MLLAAPYSRICPAGSPAEAAGLRAEDVLTRFDGKRMRDSDDLTRAVRRRQPGDRVVVELVRDGNRKRIKMEIGERPGQVTGGRMRDPFERAFGGTRRPWLGVRIAELNADLAAYFKVDPGDGVLVLSVFEDSPADKAGLKAGDIMRKLDGKRVRTEEDVIKIIANREIGEEIRIEITRKGDRKRVTATLQRARNRVGFTLRDLDKIDLDELGDEVEFALEEANKQLAKEMQKLKRELEQVQIDLLEDALPAI